MTDYHAFVQGFYQYTNINLNLYKEAQMKRRLTTLLRKKGFQNFTEYLIQLKKSDELLDECLEKMTINVSEFYRNPSRWDILRDEVLPKLTSQKKHLKIWSAAASTGEEIYTVAMMMRECFPGTSVSLYATDIDESALLKAKEGVYADRSTSNLPDAWRDTYFTKSNKTYTIARQVKEMVNFRKLNLLEDTFDSNWDLIICRNVLIYFTEEAKQGLYHKFSQALSKEGILFVGSTEQIFHPEHYQMTLDTSFFYKKMH